jgi:sugar diacid utilization regulator
MSYDGSTADLVAALAGPEPPDAVETARQARLVNARADMPYTAVAVGSQYGLPGLLPAQRHIHRILRAQLRDRVLVGQVQKFALLLVPTAHDAGRLDQLLQRALDDEVCPRGTLIGRGETAASLVEVGSSIRQSSQAAEVAGRLRRHDRVVSFLDVIPEVLLLRNPELVESLLVSRLGPLQGRPELIATLQAFLRNRLSVRRTATALTTHPNTVLYRLKRLRETLGRDFDDVEGLVDLVLALRAAELSSVEEEAGPVSRAAD